VVVAVPLLKTLSYSVTERVLLSPRPPTSEGKKEILRGSFSEVSTYLPLRYTSVFFGDGGGRSKNFFAQNQN
jgi:hypothetical protein